MKLKTGYLLAFAGVVLILATVFFISENNSDDNVIPVIQTLAIDSSENIQTSVSDFTVRFPLDINNCTVDELVLLDGIGKETAERIVDYREENGVFTDLDDLLNVNGIGKSKLDNIRSKLYIDNSVLQNISDVEEAASSASGTAYETTTVNYPLDLNLCTAEELMTLEGIGEKTAEKIILYRKEKGYFTSVDSLTEIDGIGKKTLERIRSFLFVSDEYLSSQTEATFSEPAVTEKAAVFPLDLNEATAQELMLIDGIGETLAKRIVGYAENYGFDSVDELDNVDGIGEAMLEKIREYVTVSKE